MLLNPGYGVGGNAARKGDPYAAAFLLNRLQAMSTVPLLNTADFETGVGFRICGATRLPRAMAMGATRGEHRSAPGPRGRAVTAIESRALGVGVNFAPIADVNNNARNPVINIRSFGEDPKLVSRRWSAPTSAASRTAA